MTRSDFVELIVLAAERGALRKIVFSKPKDSEVKKGSGRLVDMRGRAQMRPYSAFINTGRGAQVVEAELVRALTERPDITAVLDVTWPEPAEYSHPFYSLPNCVLTPHIAGSVHPSDQVRMVEYMIEEYENCVKGLPRRFQITEKMLETLA